jgi:hypothetical protein
MSVILRYIEGCQHVGPDKTAYLISFKSNYVFEKLQMQNLTSLTEVNSHSATEKKMDLLVNLHSYSLYSYWPCVAIAAYDIKQTFA